MSTNRRMIPLRLWHREACPEKGGDDILRGKEQRVSYVGIRVMGTLEKSHQFKIG